MQVVVSACNAVCYHRELDINRPHEVVTPCCGFVTHSVTVYPAGASLPLPVNLDGAGKLAKLGWVFSDPTDPILSTPGLLKPGQCVWTTFCEGFCAKDDGSYYRKTGVRCGAGYKSSFMFCINPAGCSYSDVLPVSVVA